MDPKLSNTYSVNKPTCPKKLMTEEEYRARVKELANTENFIEADDEFLGKLNALTLDLKTMITYNADTVKNGTVYYVSNGGNDDNDGLSPETAWATLDKVNKTVFTKPVTILFKRGDEWRGYIDIRSDMTFSAYGEGMKPKIISAYNASYSEKWVKTDIPNVWRYEVALPDPDIPMVVYNDGETYGIKKAALEDLNEHLDFVYNSSRISETEYDNKLYVYCEKGNPAEIFKTINVNMLIKPADCTIQGLHDVLMHNIEFVYGRGVFFATRSKNVRMSYCVAGWGGGHYTHHKDRFIRYGGGAGAWHSCDKMIFDHCYFYQQFDSGVSPQYHWRDTDASVFKDFLTYDCLFETTEYTLEYFSTQNTSNDNRYENMYFGYNLCRLGGYGYGDKTKQSRYVKSWGHENPCYDCKFEYNIFDRAADISLEIIGHAPTLRGKHVSYEHIPKMNNNIYIEPKNKVFANINHIIYNFNEASYITLEKLGVEEGAVYVYCDKKDDEVILAEKSN